MILKSEVSDASTTSAGAPLVKKVFSIEIVEPLATRAGERLRALGFENVTVRHGDGYKGWLEHGPLDSIIVTAGAPYPLTARRSAQTGRTNGDPCRGRIRAPEPDAYRKRPKRSRAQLPSPAGWVRASHRREPIAPNSAVRQRNREVRPT